MNTVKSAKDLQTSSADTINGFVWQSKEKLPKTVPFIVEAQYFEQKVQKIADWNDVFNDERLKSFVIAASCLSKKSLNHINAAEQRKTIESLIDIKQLKTPKYLNEITARYYLTCGDSLGGTMRNVIGQNAQFKLTNLILSALNKTKNKVTTEANGSGKIVSVKWDGRAIYFDKKPKFIDKSVDFIFLKGNNNIEDPKSYLACGELKGGIDPAGADEHWKTARSALDRIEEVFTNKKIATPKLFFVGAAIEAAMAVEVFNRLQASRLYAAANLNHGGQMTELVDMLLQL